MAFVVRHRRCAREELNACADRLGPGFLSAVHRWLQDLADEAERGEYAISSDANAFFEQLGAEAVGEMPKTGLARWLSERTCEKLLAFVAWLKSRNPPWEFRMAMQIFMVADAASPSSPESPGVVLVLYEVDRVRGRIVVTKYPDLPRPRPTH